MVCQKLFANTNDASVSTITDKSGETQPDASVSPTKIVIGDTFNTKTKPSKDCAPTENNEENAAEKEKEKEKESSAPSKEGKAPSTANSFITAAKLLAQSTLPDAPTVSDNSKAASSPPSSHKDALVAAADFGAIARKKQIARHKECRDLTQIDAIRPSSTLGLPQKSPPDQENPPNFDVNEETPAPEEIDLTSDLPPKVDSSKAVAAFWRIILNCFLTATDIYTKQYDFNQKALLMSQLAKTTEMETTADATIALLSSETDSSGKSFDAAVAAKAKEQSSAAKRKFQSETDALRSQLAALQKSKEEEVAKRLKAERTVKSLKGQKTSPKSTRGPAEGASKTNQPAQEKPPVPTSTAKDHHRRRSNNRGKQQPLAADAVNDDAVTETTTEQQQQSGHKSRKRRGNKWKRQHRNERS